MINILLENWMFFALLAPLFWTFSNFIDKYTLEKYTVGIYDFLFVSVFSSLFILTGLIAYFGFPEFTVYSLAPIGLGITLIVSYWFYAKALELEDTSQIILMLKLLPVFTLIFAFVLLGQTISGMGILSFAVVFFGLLFISLEKRGTKIRLTGGTKWILIAIAIWALLFVGVDWALEKMPFWDYFMWEVFGTIIAVLIFLLFPAPRKEVIRGLKTAVHQKYAWSVLNNLMDNFGQLAIKKALFLGPSAGLVALVAQAQSIYGIIVGVLLTLWFPHKIKEDISKGTLSKKLIGMSIMFVGICILTFGN